jgi:glycosyltransferase involved in cell wall biosynthesis/GT2 family glycosyltransferase
MSGSSTTRTRRLAESITPDDLHPEPSRPPRLCIATWEIQGPSRNAGIGTAYTSLAEALRRAGHEVTILYLLGSYCIDGNIVDWAEHYEKAKGIRLIALPLEPTPRIHAAWASSVSYHAYNWLRDHATDFDIVHFPECQGLGFYSLLAKRQGLAFRNTMFVVSTHGPTFWVKESGQDFIRNLGELEIDHLERTSVAEADIVTSPTQYLLDWTLLNGWIHPEQTYLAPYILPENIQPSSTLRAETIDGIKEIVFFGRIEMRKGLKLFCDAIDELCEQGLEGYEITFLGKETQIFGRSSIGYLADRARRWTVPWHVVANKGQADAVAYLRQKGRLAVMPSLADNYPNTVLECIGAGIPFLAARTGGIPEIIAAEDVDHVCFEPRADHLASRLRAVLRDGGRTAKPAVAFAENERNWIDWHVALARQARDGGGRAPRHRSAALMTFPTVSLCFAYNARQSRIVTTLRSLLAQDYPFLELILMQCGVNEAVPLPTIDGTAIPDHARVMTHGSLAMGAARNAAARQATGDYLFFVDDNTLLPAANAISLFVQVAQKAPADILTSTVSFFLGSNEYRIEHSRRPFLGGDIATGAFLNGFGSTNALIRRTAFDAVGGFNDDAASTLDDWEIFSKAALQGLRISTIPEPLIWYREDETQESLVHSFANAVRSVRPYTAAGSEVAPAAASVLSKAILLSQGLKFERDVMIGTPLSRGEQGPAVTG